MCLPLLAPALLGQGGSLTVFVVDSTTQAPLVDVEVKAGQLSARTGGDGRARFDKLPAGMIYVSVSREGYLSGGDRTVRISDDGATQELKVSLPRFATLEGRVLDEEGRPMPGVIVRPAAQMWPSSSKEAATDREGRFRVEGLSTGRCRLDLLIPMELRRKMLERDNETGTLLGYPAVEFYPGVTDAGAALPIQIAGGVELHGYEVRLRRVQLADFTGRTLTRPDEPLTGVQVELQTPGSTPMLDETLGSRAVDAEGRFRFELIPPGAYVLLVYRGENGSGLPYIQPIEVAKSGAGDKSIMVPPWQTLRGILRVKDNADWSGGVTVSVSTDQKGVPDRDLTIRQGGDFVLEDIPPGQWQLNITTSPATVRTSDQHKLKVTRTRFGVANPLAGPITVAESGNPLLDIEISADTGRIAGRIVGGLPQMISVRQAEVPLRLSMGAVMMTKPDGAFVTDELAPGLYDVQPLAGKTVRVQVKAGETTTVELDAVVRKGQ
jgi:hypothetical protein